MNSPINGWFHHQQFFNQCYLYNIIILWFHINKVTCHIYYIWEMDAKMSNIKIYQEIAYNELEILTEGLSLWLSAICNNLCAKRYGWLIFHPKLILLTRTNPKNAYALETTSYKINIMSICLPGIVISLYKNLRIVSLTLFCG